MPALAPALMIYTSGTTGKPIVVAYTQEDVQVWTNVMLRSFASCGLHEGDIIQNAYGYGLFTGGLGAHYGAERLGASVIPISGGNTARQLMIMQDFGSTILADIWTIETTADAAAFEAKRRLLREKFGRVEEDLVAAPYLTPSTYNRVVIEAQALGRPLVVSAVVCSLPTPLASSAPAPPRTRRRPMPWTPPRRVGGPPATSPTPGISEIAFSTSAE